MSIHDYAIADAAGATFRADLNNALAAIVSNNSNATAPSPTFAYMWWADTTANALKQRNAANTAWHTLFTIDETNGLLRWDFDKAADIASATTTDIGGATANTVTITGTTTITALGTIKAGVWRLVRFAGALLLTHNGTSLILPGGADITTAAGDMMLAVSEGSGNWRVAFYQRADGQAVKSPISMAKAPPEISNNAGDPTDSIDVAVGKCRDDADTANLNVTTAIGKDISATWAAGGTTATPTGGLSSSLTLTNDTWYHVILGLVSGTEEVGFDDDPTGATLVTDHSFTNTRRIGSVRRDTATNRAFLQDGDDFRWDVPFQDLTTNPAATTAQTLAVRTPAGIRTRARLSAKITDTGANFLLITSWDQTDTTPSAAAKTLTQSGASATGSVIAEIERWTDTSSQIRWRVNATTINNLEIETVGWTDRRGRDA